MLLVEVHAELRRLAQQLQAHLAVPVRRGKLKRNGGIQPIFWRGGICAPLQIATSFSGGKSIPQKYRNHELRLSLPSAKIKNCDNRPINPDSNSPNEGISATVLAKHNVGKRI